MAKEAAAEKEKAKAAAAEKLKAAAAKGKAAEKEENAAAKERKEREQKQTGQMVPSYETQQQIQEQVQKTFWNQYQYILSGLADSVRQQVIRDHESCVGAQNRLVN